MKRLATYVVAVAGSVTTTWALDASMAGAVAIGIAWGIGGAVAGAVIDRSQRADRA